MAKLRKKKAGLPFGPERKNTIGQIKYRPVHDVEITVLDRADAFEREIHLFAGNLPRRRAALAQAGRKKAVVDMISLAAKLLQHVHRPVELAATCVDR